MFGIGSQELLLILLAVLLLFGGKRIPEVARSLGKGMAEIRRAMREVQREVDLEMLKTPESDRRAPAPGSVPSGHAAAQPQGDAPAAAQAAEPKPGQGAPGQGAAASPAEHSGTRPGGAPPGTPKGVLGTGGDENRGG